MASWRRADDVRPLGGDPTSRPDGTRRAPGDEDRGRDPTRGTVGNVETTLLRLRTGSEPTVVDLTREVEEFCQGQGDGLVSLFLPHATAGLAIIETGAGSEDDLVALLEDLVPRDDRWRHRHGSRGHGADHVLPALVSPSITIPVLGSRPQLGTWQSIVLVDTNRDDAERQLRLSFVRACTHDGGDERRT